MGSSFIIHRAKHMEGHHETGKSNSAVRASSSYTSHFGDHLDCTSHI